MPKQPFKDSSGDFLAFVEDLKRKNTKSFPIGDRTFHLRGPALLTDEEITRLGDEKANVVDKARAVIDDYDGFCEAGGTAMFLMSWYDEQFEAEGAVEGKGGASSSS